MTKKIIDFFINSLLITIFIFVFIYSKDIKETIIYGINIWLYNLIPSILPFLLISKLMIYNNFFYKINNIFGKYLEHIFNISNNSTFVIILSTITGFPTGSIYIKDLLDKNQISVEEANKLITFTSFSNPLFIISFIGEILLKSKRIGIFIYLIHLLTGLSIGLLNKNKTFDYKSINKDTNKLSFINRLTKSINESFNILANMLGIILFFLIIISIINIIMPHNSIMQFINCFLEITTGVINISQYNLSMRLKASLIGAIISFNGLSIHFQIKSIIDNTQIKYCNYLYARILHSLLCFIIIYLLFFII